MLRRFKKKMSFEGEVSSHCGRVYVASKWESEFGIFKAKEYIGHESIQTTVNYSKKGPLGLDELVEVF